jgi:uncharacterized protein YjbI with pentapeptide repeats
MARDIEPNGRGRSNLPSPRDSIADRFVDRADLTALVLHDATIEGASVRQALLSGTLFRNCTFIRCNFSRADFEGAVMESCTFRKCDFSIADLRSVEATRSQFIDCTFSEGSTRSCEFIDCTFEKTTFTLHNFENNRVERAVLLNCLLERSTLLHCRFISVRFEGTDLADCTSQFHLFEDCTFVNSRLNAEAIGLTFGLTIENLKDLGLVWRGEGVEAHAGSGDIASDLTTTYTARGWHFAAAMLKLNFGLETRSTALGETFAALMATARSPLPIKSDEVQFLAAVIEWLSEKGKLPFVSIAAGLDAIADSADARAGRDLEALRPLFHALKDAEHIELDALDQNLSPLLDEPSAHEMLTVSFVFETEPSASFRNWVDDLAAARLVPGPAPRFRNSARGSYVEYFYMAAASLAGILICLTLVERIVDRLIWIRARAGVLASGKLPSVIRRRALQPVASGSPAVIRELRTLLDHASGPNGSHLVDHAHLFAEKLTKIEVGGGGAELT